MSQVLGLTIYIGSTRSPKVSAVKTVFSRIRNLLVPDAVAVRFVAAETASDISNMPLSEQETMLSAFNRAGNLRKEYPRGGPAFFIGLEGGFYPAPGAQGETRWFLQGWAYVTDGAQGHYGASGSVEVPEIIARTVLEGDRELGEIIDQFGNAGNIRNQNGAVGVFTRDHIVRQQMFETALIAAFSPFFNKDVYAA